MPRFRKKPVEVEAVRVADLLGPLMWPDWITEAVDGGDLTVHVDQGRVSIETLEGVMDGATDDWIIQGVMGELYPCKPDIFAATYKPVL